MQFRKAIRTEEKRGGGDLDNMPDLAPVHFLLAML